MKINKSGRDRLPHQVRFDLMMASDVLSHKVAVLARQFPNVSASGYWWHKFFPGTIEKSGPSSGLTQD